VLDLGFSEILLLGAVALIVLGPEKLPHAARMLGAWYGRIRRTLADVQAEISNEVHLSEMRQRMNDELAKVRAAEDSLGDKMHDIEQGIEQSLENSVEQDVQQRDYNAENRIYPNAQSQPKFSSFESMSQYKNDSDYIHSPFKPYTSSYYFFVLTQPMYASLIPSAPYLPKSHIVQYIRRSVDHLDNSHLTDQTSP
jgi:sec-independent protein translocase protein TatB